jgi:hypothetical protein
MKKLFVSLFFLWSIWAVAQEKPKTENVILITLDGYRWQELFGGLDKKWATKKYVAHVSKLKEEFDAPTPEERRHKLMPFFWGTIARQGTLIGNRKLDSKMDVSNRYKFSYPGYSEMFCGYEDPRVNSNDYPDNPNKNIFDFISAQPGFENKVVAFATWDAFPRIINTTRNKVPVFVSFKKENHIVSGSNVSYVDWQTTRPAIDPYIVNDTMTYHFAKEYLYRNHPRFVFIGFDQTDGFAHEGRYDAYLHATNTLDRFIEDLWNLIQNDPEYKNKTAIIITTDHGRGNKRPGMWKHHGKLVKDADEIWLAAIGPDILANGEVKDGKKYYQKQIAQTIVMLLGMKYTDAHSVAPPIDLLVK